VGYTVQVLRRELRQILGLNRRWGLCIVGMGRLGQAIADYPGFSEIFELRGLFDRDPSKITTTFRGLQVESMDNLPRAVAERRIDFGLLAVPADSAQAVADRLVESGIKGILNFAPAVLEVPKEVAVENVDFLAGLSRLSFFVLNPKWREEMIG